jgi:hypothetical protein
VSAGQYNEGEVVELLAQFNIEISGSAFERYRQIAGEINPMQIRQSLDAAQTKEDMYMLIMEINDIVNISAAISGILAVFNEYSHREDKAHLFTPDIIDWLERLVNGANAENLTRLKK